MLSIISDIQSKIQTQLNRLKKKSSNPKLLLAWSGGKDSTLLLYFLKFQCKQDISAAYFNHGLRSQDEMQKEAHWVKKQAAEWDIPLFTGKAEQGQIEEYSHLKKTSLEEAARIYRYDFLKQLMKHHSFDHLLTAHHKDDQTETMLLNFFQGAGPLGLTGLKDSDAFPFSLQRPLITVCSEEIDKAASILKLEWSEDQSNQSSRFLRNALRHEILPQIKTHFPGLNSSLARAAEKNSLCRDWVTEELNKIELIQCDGGIAVKRDEFLSCSGLLRLELLYRMIDQVLDGQGRALRIPYRFFRDLLHVDSLTHIRREGHGVILRPVKSRLEIISAEQVEAALDPIKVYWDKTVLCGNWQIFLSEKEFPGSVPIHLTDSPVFIRPREEGDLWKKPGALKKKLSQWPKEERRQVPLLAQGNRIITILRGNSKEVMTTLSDPGEGRLCFIGIKGNYAV